MDDQFQVCGRHRKRGEGNSGERRRRAAVMAVVQVTKSNLSAVLQKLKEQIRSAEFIAVSTQKTGDCGSRHPWRRILPIDTPDTAYLKAKLSAETYQIFQFAVCPFRFHGPKLRASPYNFHLFPRDELSLGMPSYSFSCQTSFLTSMAQEGFDFNGCIYDGISYLSRVQESRANERNPIPRIRSITSSPNPSVADTIFMGRIKSKVGHWRSACKDPDKSTDGPLVKSLRRLILGGDVYGSRPCLNVDVCTERQVQLVLETVNQIGDDLVPLVVPDTSGEPKSVRVVLTSSAENKSNLMTEIQNLEEEQNIKVRGFREVIDLISESRKPIIAYNCLHDFAFIHSKFLSPLPTSLTEFLSSLRTVFPNVVDVNHLLKEVGPLRKAKSIPAALHYLKRQFFVPVDVEISHQAQGSTTEKCHGHQVVRLTHLFAKLGNLLKIVPSHQTSPDQQTVPIEEHANNFFPFCASLDGLGNDDNVDVGFWRDNAVRRTTTNNLVFLWGFNRGISASDLKHRLREAHISFADNFELQLVDKSCAVVVFGRPSSAEALLNDMRDEKASSVLKGMIFQGLKAAGYESYAKVCRKGLWEAELADSLTRASNDFTNELSTDCCEQGLEIYWCDDFVIKLQDL